VSQDWYALTPRIGEETEERGGGIPTLCITEVSDLDGPRTSPGAEGTEVAMLTGEMGGGGTVHRETSRTNDSGGGPDGGDSLARTAAPQDVDTEQPRRCHRTEKNDDIKLSPAADRLMTDGSMTLDRKSGGRTPDDDDHPGWSE